MTYFVLVNIQLGRKKLYRNDNELANHSIQCRKYRIFLTNQSLARCETVLPRPFLLTFQEEHEICRENLIMNQINVCNALTVAYGTIVFLVFISKEICRISIYYFVIFNKVVDVIEQKPQ